ncbi:rab15 effector protein-like [Acipenser oxyrinchus oxyrinchus]|uniref:Rab15 effector protein-like n=1 Tax=Acipenser oxyrinchus oxyrinchus TaxID=40147 RepID=A0AAD8FTG8_ACIOX|nr:rab15 effector protein-like [Acipenser oxyrinchus oxyrinchus]KAK1152674.1 rab15 effector protein-like [Acipenser oxyrinchus oxyrinchus]
MGQSQTIPLQPPDEKLDVVFEVFAQAVLHASQKLKQYLGFVDPQQTLRVSTSTLNAVFLIHFIGFCKEKGVDGCISTRAMTRQQEMLMGVSWIWTLTCSSRISEFQIAVRSVQTSGTYRATEADEDPYQKRLEQSISDLDRNKSCFDKLFDFSSSVGVNCMSLCIVYGLPGKPREIRGVRSKDLVRFKAGESGSFTEEMLLRYLQGADTFITTTEMIQNHLWKQSRSSDSEHVYVNFL